MKFRAELSERTKCCLYSGRHSSPPQKLIIIIWNHKGPKIWKKIGVCSNKRRPAFIKCMLQWLVINYLVFYLLWPLSLFIHDSLFTIDWHSHSKQINPSSLWDQQNWFKILVMFFMNSLSNARVCCDLWFRIGVIYLIDWMGFQKGRPIKRNLSTKQLIQRPMQIDQMHWLGLLGLSKFYKCSPPLSSKYSRFICIFLKYVWPWFW